MDKVDLPSGAKLEITLGSFVESKALLQAVMEEVKGVHADPDVEMDTNLFKDLFCVGIASKKIEGCLEVLMRRTTYNGHKISSDTWESEKAREDYLAACFEVARVNLSPFTKALMQKFSQALEMAKKNLA